jgi:hypothetical protein
VAPDANRTRSARIAAGVTTALVCALIYFGNLWWSASAAAYARSVYKPPPMSAHVESGKLELTLSDPGWLRTRRVDDLIADRGHPLDLFVVQAPGLERFWHLHPAQVAPGRFEQAMPDLPAGKLELFARIVHGDGLPETLVASLDLPAASSGPLRGDDSAGQAPPLGMPGEASAKLSDGGRLVCVHDGPLVANETQWLRFRGEDATGHPLSGPQTSAQATVFREDLSVFAQLQPSGSVPPASWALANPRAGPEPQPPPGSEVSFPYAFPAPGRYRIFVQVQRAGHLEIGAVDLEVG